MALSSVSLRTAYRSDDSNIADDFLIPCLAQALRYDRATGYFSSRILPRILTGLATFIQRGGRIRLVSSPHLTADDIEQIERGYATREFVIGERIEESLNALALSERAAYDRLAWLIANDILDIRLAVPRDRTTAGIYHEKFGIFRDEGSAVAFSGSLNETYAAVEGNFEHIDVYASWQDPQRVQEKVEYFRRLWEGETPTLDVLDFPEAQRKRLICEAPIEYIEQPATATQENDPRQLAKHQERALEAWRNANCRGLLEMATGTGKTFTALQGADALLKRSAVTTVLILAPYIAIADQWREEISRTFGVEPIVCHSQSGDWKGQLRMHVALSKVETPAKTFIVALYDTASGDGFIERASNLPHPVLVVADEVHNITPDNADRVLRDNYELRLGLSATPDRYLDDIGTAKIREYFGGTVFHFGLSEAIAANILTPYDYFPIVCTDADEHGPSHLDGVNGAKLNRFMKTFPATRAAQQGYTLVYCQWQQIDETKEWLGHTLNRAIHTFTAEEDLVERRDVLREFGEGHLHALVAIRCLDEGVDVPPTRFAFLLASSENPKQFVQRRGRVLRKYPGKRSAAIFDYIYLPKLENKAAEDHLRKELTRFAEFAASSQNSDEATSVILKAADDRGISLRNYVIQGL